jgi:hypothetical protein
MGGYGVAAPMYAAYAAPPEYSMPGGWWHRVTPGWRRGDACAATAVARGAAARPRPPRRPGGPRSASPAPARPPARPPRTHPYTPTPPPPPPAPTPVGVMGGPGAPEVMYAPAPAMDGGAMGGPMGMPMGVGAMPMAGAAARMYGMAAGPAASPRPNGLPRGGGAPVPRSGSGGELCDALGAGSNGSAGGGNWVQIMDPDGKVYLVNQAAGGG